MSRDRTVTARVPSDLVDRIDELRRALAAKERRPVLTRSQVIEMALEDWWEFFRHEVHDDGARKIRSRLGV